MPLPRLSLTLGLGGLLSFATAGTRLRVHAYGYVFRVRDSLGIGQGERGACQTGCLGPNFSAPGFSVFNVFMSAFNVYKLPLLTLEDSQKVGTWICPIRVPKIEFLI